MHEMSPPLRFAMRHFAGGDAFFVGLAVFVIAQCVLLRVPPGRLRRVWVVVSRLGVIWGCVVPAPVPMLGLVLFAVLLMRLWLYGFAASRLESPLRPSDSAPKDGSHRDMTASDLAALNDFRRCRTLPMVMALVLIAYEVPYRFSPVAPPFSPSLTKARPRFDVVGDSVTAGLNDGEETWPKRLAQRSCVDIFDASQPGATLRSAITQVQWLPRSKLPADLLLLEVGGNDMLEGVAVSQFERDLNELLGAARGTFATVWMIELPMPPLGYRYCEAQRRLAWQHGVALVPRRFLLRVLTTPGATVDGIHLSAQGHQQLADMMFELLKPVESDRAAKGVYQRIDKDQNR